MRLRQAQIPHHCSNGHVRGRRCDRTPQLLWALYPRSSKSVRTGLHGNLLHGCLNVCNSYQSMSCLFAGKTNVVPSIISKLFIEFPFMYIQTTTLSAYMIGWVGHRNTALFGMILFFIGILLDAFTIHYAVFYVVNLGFFAIGGGLAYGSAMAVAGYLHT